MFAATQIVKRVDQRSPVLQFSLDSPDVGAYSAPRGWRGVGTQGAGTSSVCVCVSVCARECVYEFKESQCISMVLCCKVASVIFIIIIFFY